MKRITSTLRALTLVLPLSLAAAGAITVTSGVALSPQAQAFGLSDITDAAKGVAKEAKRAATDFGKTVARDVKRAGKAVGRGVKGTVKEAGRAGKDFGKTVGRDVVRAGKAIGRGIKKLGLGHELNRPGVPLAPKRPVGKLPPSRLDAMNRTTHQTAKRNSTKAATSALPPARGSSLPAGDTALPPARGVSASASSDGSKLPPPRRTNERVTVRRKVQGITEEDVKPSNGGCKAMHCKPGRHNAGDVPRDKSVWGNPVGKRKHDVARDRSIFGKPVGSTNSKLRKRVSKKRMMTRELKMHRKRNGEVTTRKLNKLKRTLKAQKVKRSLKKVGKKRKILRAEHKDRRRRDDS